MSTSARRRLMRDFKVTFYSLPNPPRETRRLELMLTDVCVENAI